MKKCICWYDSVRFPLTSFTYGCELSVLFPMTRQIFHVVVLVCNCSFGILVKFGAVCVFLAVLLSVRTALHPSLWVDWRSSAKVNHYTTSPEIIILGMRKTSAYTGIVKSCFWSVDCFHTRWQKNQIWKFLPKWWTPLTWQLTNRWLLMLTPYPLRTEEVYIAV